MKNEQWHKVKEIFDSALQQKPEDRQKYLNEACGDDKNLLNDEVYLAKDKKLNRQVAIKILNEKFTSHESNLQRFLQQGVEIVTEQNHTIFL
jgi:hypothetical protein